MVRGTRTSLLALVLLGASASSVRAQPLSDPAAEARRQFNLGTQAFAAKRFAEAAQSFEAAAAYKAHAVTLYTAGLAWEQAGRPERAADDYSRALEVPGLNADQEKSARDKLAQLEKQLATASVTGPDGTRAQLDALTDVPTPAHLHALAGPHVLTFTLPGKPSQKKELRLEEGKITAIDLVAEAKAAEAAAAASAGPATGAREDGHAAGDHGTESSGEDPGVKLRKSLALVAIGIGVAGVAGTAILGVEGLGARDAYDDTPTRSTFDHAHSLQTWTNVFLVGSAVFLVGGAVLYFLPAPATNGHVRIGVAPAPGGAAASLGGRF